MTSPASPGFAGQNSTPVSSFKRGLFSRLSRRSIQQADADVQKTNSQRSADGSTRPSLDFPSDLCSFQSLWRDAVTAMNESADIPERRTSTTIDSCELVIKSTLQMVKILTKKGDTSELGSSVSECDSRILDYFYSEEVLVKLLDWTNRRPEFERRVKLHLLCLFDSILGQGSCQFFMDRQILRPLFRLMTSCSETKEVMGFEEKLAVVFHRLCFGISQYSEVLEALFSDAYMNSDSGGHSLISLLIRYIHWDGPVGQQARDALQVIVCLSSAHEEVSTYIVSKSNFCPVLAAGLTGLYSSLPRTLAYSSDDWSGLSEDDIRSSLDLQRFLTSLAFCNDIIKVSPPSLRQHLLEFIYSGFLVPVIAPGLHQEDSGVDGVIATTAYLNLFLTKLTEPHLLRVFLRFILLVKVDELSILDLLIQRISSQQTKLCVVTLVLFKSMVELNCEDVMYCLVFKYLMPCTHVMVSQQRSIADVDLYCRNAEKLLSLIPECCSIDVSPIQSSPSDSLNQFERSKWWQSIRRKKTPSNNRAESFNGSSPAHLARNSVGDVGSPVPLEDLLESSYIEYLHSAMICLDQCRTACRNWSGTYDGRGTGSSADVRLSLSEGVVPVSCSTKAVDGALRLDNPIAPGLGAAEPAVSSVSTRMHGMHCGDNELQGFNSTGMTTELGTSGPGDGVWATSAVIGGRTGLGSMRELNRVPSCLLEDLDTFMMQLSRVQVPDSESQLEEVLGELDSLLADADNRRIAASSVGENSRDGVFEASSNPASNEQVTRTLPHVVVAMSSDSGSNKQTEMSNNASSSLLQASLEPTKIEVQDDQSLLLRPTRLGLTPPSSPTSSRNSALSPSVGPFLTTLLQRLETMKQNTFYVNLHLTGLLARLACYPQPLLQSLLLSQTLVFQPSIKSLAQVLNFVKCRLDEYFLTVSQKDVMMIQAQHYLRYRDGQMRNDSRRSLGDIRLTSPAAKVVPPKQPRLTLLGSRHGARYTPQSPAAGHASMNQDSPEFVEKKNAIYCALILKEFLKELAAISQEHTVLQTGSS